MIHYGHFPIFAVMAHLNMAINMVFMGVYAKFIKIADQQQHISENMQMVKSCCKNKFVTQIMAISLVFWPQFDQI
jgi:hypothetical protein